MLCETSSNFPQTKPMNLVGLHVRPTQVSWQGLNSLIFRSPITCKKEIKKNSKISNLWRNLLCMEAEKICGITKQPNKLLYLERKQTSDEYGMQRFMPKSDN